MNEPGEVKAELLAIVVLDEIDRLHILQESSSEEHTSREGPAVSDPGLVDQVAILHVNWEVIKDDTTLPQVVNVNFLLESLHHNCLNLACVEGIEHVASVALEGQLGIVLRKAALDLEDLAHEVND